MFQSQLAQGVTKTGIQRFAARGARFEHDRAATGTCQHDGDVGAQAAIWDHIKQARRDGLAVLLISADLEELVGLSDTVRVILRGALSGAFDPDTVTREELGAAMTGAGAGAPTDEGVR